MKLWKKFWQQRLPVYVVWALPKYPDSKTCCKLLNRCCRQVQLPVLMKI